MPQNQYSYHKLMRKLVRCAALPIGFGWIRMDVPLLSDADLILYVGLKTVLEARRSASASCLDGPAGCFTTFLLNAMNPDDKMFEPNRHCDNTLSQSTPVPTFAADQEESMLRLSQLRLSATGSLPQQLPPPELSWPEGDLGFHHEWSLPSSTAPNVSSGSTITESSCHSLDLNADRYKWPSFPSWNMNAPVLNGYDATSLYQPTIVPETGFCPGGQALPSLASSQARPPSLSLDLGLGQDFNRISACHYTQPLLALQPHRLCQLNIPNQTPSGTSCLRTSLDTQTPTQPAALATSAMATSQSTMSLAASRNLLSTVPDRFGMSDCSHQANNRNELHQRHPGSIQQPSGLDQQCFDQRSAQFAHPEHGSRSGYGDRAERPQGSSPFNQKTEEYKSELCRNWEEKGSYYYRSRCQFAHGEHELRKVERNPRWKSRLCKRYQLFIHDPNSKPEQVASINRARRSSLLQRVGIVPSPSNN
ncbi:hypothetical protein PHSY_003901 [Pseudozyma hubeiensis SY62]|uniref:C3H1-type domain-containing protein n=1 Tax=Pseudozyma hubeiensis (strain SY62) TaxID=1305764 RepID=R9P4R6_PSEHS|nr:hypothetical protein PHSY_003901 [Pseudozyma hubeiensis SY62]GAC96321.1 hypothetical protein PHSY_003901 [Pseudozyma hubeiensis SY62]